MARPRALTSIQIELIRGFYKDGGKSPAELAAVYGVSPRTIQRLVKDLKPEPRYFTRSMSDARFEELCSLRRRGLGDAARRDVPYTPFEIAARRRGFSQSTIPWDLLITIPDTGKDGRDHEVGYYLKALEYARRREDEAQAYEALRDTRLSIDTADELAPYLAKMSPLRREIILLRLKGFNYREIHRKTGDSFRTIKKAIDELRNLVKCKAE